MKKFLVFVFSLSLFFIVSCDSESSKNADVTDYSEDTGDTEPTATGDTAETTDDETQPTQVCGNETVEYGERCDSIVATTCSNLNLNMSGTTKCLTDCTAFDMSTCEKKVWGTLNIRFSTKFIMDNAKIGDPEYFSQGALSYSAFNGLYGDSNQYFPKTSDSSVSFAVTDNYTSTFGANKRQLFIKQIPASGYPRHELEFAPETIKSGEEYRINAVSPFDSVDNNLFKLVRYRLVDSQNGTECIMGIGYSGSVSIASVFPENFDLYEGGSIEIVTNNVDFYYPAEIPEVDEKTAVPEEILKYPLCSK